MTSITYRFRCPSCPYSVEVLDRSAMPSSCPMCGAKREMRDTAAVIKKGQTWRPEEDRRH